jgi:hypothetical protein
MVDSTSTSSGNSDAKQCATWPRIRMERMEPTATFELPEPARDELIMVKIPVSLDMLDPARRDAAIKTLGESVYEAAKGCLEKRERALVRHPDVPGGIG